MSKTHIYKWVIAAIMPAALLAGCRSPQQHRQEADRAAYGIVARTREQMLGDDTPFTIEPPGDTLRRRLMLDQHLPHSGPASLGSGDLPTPPHWPLPPDDSNAVVAATGLAANLESLSLTQALQIAARNNREYQSRKEDVFRAALALDLEANQFRGLLAGDVESEFRADHSGDTHVRGLANTGNLGWQRRLKYGTLLTTRIAVDLVKLLTLDRASSFGIFADATISVPLLRGAGRHIVAEPLTQAEQDVVYALFAFERYRQQLAVRVASDYMAVLQQLDQVHNAEDNYRRLTASTERSRRLADAGRLPRIQVDQALQDDLRARDRWTSAMQSYARRLDNLKITMGLPTDAVLAPDRDELTHLAAAAGLAGSADETGHIASAPGPWELDPAQAVSLALDNRLDLRTAQGRVFDTQRKAVVAADALRMGLKLHGSAAAGGRRGLASADRPDVWPRPDEGIYTAGLSMDLPLERTSERNAWRNSLIALERAVRDFQALEDQIKLEVRDALRAMQQARESYQIQQQALIVADRRVASSELFMQAGRAQMRDLLEAQEALVSARNAVTTAMVNYRVAELQLQRDMGILAMESDGGWREQLPETDNE